MHCSGYAARGGALVGRSLRSVLFGGVLAVLALGCTAKFPVAPETPPAGPTAQEILARSIAASGGDPYASLQDIAVRYDGTWGPVVEFLQPALTDSDYRGSSEERYLLEPDVMAQVHRGPGGEKRVWHDPGTIRVFYGGVPSADDEVLATSALVADAYGLFLVGPAWLERRGRDWQRLPDVDEEGRSYYRLLGTLRPGVGLSEEDQVVAWVDTQTGLLHRVHFTLEGYEGTRGAHVDVTFFDYRSLHGRLWPTRFIERVIAPVSAHAHLWTMEGLDVNRGLTAEDLGTGADPRWSPAAARPAGEL